VDVVKRLDFARQVFVIGDTHVDGCTLFDELLQDSGTVIKKKYNLEFYKKVIKVDRGAAIEFVC
jgi:hypothetical protein